MLTFAVKKKRTPSIAPKRHAPTTSTMTPRRDLDQARVRHILRSPTLQAKLTIGQPNDKYEQEADRVADEVMRMPEPRLQRQVEPEEEEEEETLQARPLAQQITPLFQRQVEPEEEEEEEEPIQAKSADGMQVQRQEEEPEEEEEPIQAKQAGRQTPQLGPGVEALIRSLRGGGQPLPECVRAFFEPRLGYDFSQVRVHTDARAAESARALNAQAYTVGRDVVFGPCQYRPQTTTGRQLIAHELTHVVQQSRQPSQRRIQRMIGFEFELNYTAQKLTRPGGWYMLQTIPDGALVRQYTLKDNFKIEMDGKQLEITTLPFEEFPKARRYGGKRVLGKAELVTCMNTITKLAQSLENQCQSPRKKLPPRKRFALTPSLRKHRRWFRAPAGLFNVSKYRNAYLRPYRKAVCKVFGVPQATVGIRLEKFGELVGEIKKSLQPAWRKSYGIAFSLTGPSTKRLPLGHTSKILFWAQRQVQLLYRRRVQNKRRRMRWLRQLQAKGHLRSFIDIRFHRAFTVELRNFMTLVLSYLRTSTWTSTSDKELYAKAYPPIVSHTAFRDIYKLLGGDSRKVFAVLKDDMYRLARGKSGTKLFPPRVVRRGNLPYPLSWSAWISTIIKDKPPYTGKPRTLVTPAASKYGPEEVGRIPKRGMRKLGPIVELRRIGWTWWPVGSWTSLALGVYDMVKKLNWDLRRPQHRPLGGGVAKRP